MCIQMRIIWRSRIYLYIVSLRTAESRTYILRSAHGSNGYSYLTIMGCRPIVESHGWLVVARVWWDSCASGRAFHCSLGRSFFSLLFVAGSVGENRWLCSRMRCFRTLRSSGLTLYAVRSWEGEFANTKLPLFYDIFLFRTYLFAHSS